MAETWCMGIDAGSTASKCVVVDANGDIAATGLYGAGAGTVGPQRAAESALSKLGIATEDIACTCATGYGRHLLDGSNMQVSELSCHAKGAAKLFPGAPSSISGARMPRSCA